MLTGAQAQLTPWESGSHRDGLEAIWNGLGRFGSLKTLLQISAMHHSPGFLRIVGDAKSRIRETDVETVKARIDRRERFLLIDVREESEWAAGRLPGAIHLGKGVIERDVETRVPDPETEIVLYCGGGYRSALAADNLQRMGYSNVSSMDGGIRGWAEAGHAIEL